MGVGLVSHFEDKAMEAQGEKLAKAFQLLTLCKHVRQAGEWVPCC